MTPAGTAAPTCPNGSTGRHLAKTTTTRTTPVTPPGRRPVPRPDQPHRPGLHPPTAGPPPPAKPAAGTDRPRRHPPPARRPPPPSPHRWCVTLLAPDGTAVAHGCARGPHPWIPPPADSQEPGTDPTPAGRRARRTPARAEHHLHPHHQRDLRPAGQEDRYTPSRKLRHLIRARTARAPPPAAAPACSATATTPSPTRGNHLPVRPRHPPAAATTAASKHPAGGSPNPNPHCTDHIIRTHTLPADHLRDLTANLDLTGGGNRLTLTGRLEGGDKSVGVGKAQR